MGSFRRYAVCLSMLVAFNACALSQMLFAQIEPSVIEAQQTYVAEQLEKVTAELETYTDETDGVELLRERQRWLKAHVEGGDVGIADDVKTRLVTEFWERRLLDQYQQTTKDPKKIQKLVVRFLKNAAKNYAELGRLGNRTKYGFGRPCWKAGVKDPVFCAVSVDAMDAPDDAVKMSAAAWKDSQRVFELLDADEYSPFIRALGRQFQHTIMHKGGSIFGEYIYDDEAVKTTTAKYHEALIAALADESACPENYPALDWLLKYPFNHYRPLDELNDLQERITKSKLEPWIKNRCLQKLFDRLRNQRDISNEEQEEFAALAVDYGDLAHGQMLLSPLPAMDLTANAASSGEEDQQRQWGMAAIARAPAQYRVYKNHFSVFARMRDKENAMKFIAEVALSNRFAAGTPWFAFELTNSGFSLNPKDKELNAKVLNALASVFDRAQDNPENKLASKQQKRYKQLLVSRCMMAENYSLATRLARDLKGDFGPFKMFRNTELTVSRIANMGSPIVKETRAAIDQKKLEIDKLDDTIQQLAFLRMDLDPEEGLDIDELTDLLTTIKDLEAGEWANLTPPKIYLANWSATSMERWKAREGEFECTIKSSNMFDRLYWKWPIDGPFIAEIDFQDHKGKKFKPKHGTEIGVSAGAKFGPCKTNIMVNPHQAMGIFRRFRDREFSLPMPMEPSKTHRMRVRFWKDYLEFTVDGAMAGKYAANTVFPTLLSLEKGYGLSKTEYRNVRIRKLDQLPPTGELRDSEAYWTERIAFEPEAADLYVARAQSRLRTNTRTDFVIDDFEKAIQLAPDVPVLKVQMIDALISLKQTGEALQQLTKVKEASPEIFESNRMLQTQHAAMLAGSGDAENAKQAMNAASKALELTPKPRRGQRVKMMELKALCQAAASDFADATATQKQAIEKSSTFQDIQMMKRVLQSYEDQQMPEVRPASYYYEPFTDAVADPQPRQPPAVTQDLAAMWTFDTDVRESLQGEPSFDRFGAQIVQGKRRGCLHLADDDFSDCVVAASPIDVSEPWTVAFWLNSWSEQGSILSQFHEMKGLSVGVVDKKLTVELGARVSPLRARSKDRLPRNRWVHVAITYDGADEASDEGSGFEIFIDGKPATGYQSKKGFRGNIDFENSQIQFGGESNLQFSGVGLGGLLDEVHFYTRKLDTDEIAAVFEEKE